MDSEKEAATERAFKEACLAAVKEHRNYVVKKKPKKFLGLTLGLEQDVIKFRPLSNKADIKLSVKYKNPKEADMAELTWREGQNTVYVAAGILTDPALAYTVEGPAESKNDVIQSTQDSRYKEVVELLETAAPIPPQL